MSAIRVLNPAMEDGPDYIRLRVENPDEALASPSNVTAVSYRVIEYCGEEEAHADRDGEPIVPATAVDPADCLFALRPWPKIDDTGYNFELFSPGTNRPNGNKWVRHQITFTPLVGPAYTVVTVNQVLPVNDG